MHNCINQLGNEIIILLEVEFMKFRFLFSIEEITVYSAMIFKVLFRILELY